MTDAAAWPYPWLAETWTALQRALLSDRLGAAVLISGPVGVGRHALVDALIGLGVCREPQDGQACGRCPECIQFRAGSHPDVLLLAPPEGKQVIAVEDLRDLLGALTLTRHYGRRRFVRIDPADALNESGVNALLKTIEEPPEQTHVLLISERPQELAPTVRSRCRQHRVALPPAEQARAWLQGQGVDASVADAVLLAAGGAPCMALSLSQGEDWSRIDRWQRTLEAVEGRRLLPQAAAKALAEAREAEPFLRWLQHQLFARIRHSALRDGQGPAPLKQLAQQAEQAIECRRMLKGNVSPKMVLESMLIALLQR